MNDLKAQYKTPDNLNTRISIHAKYSLNKEPFGDWIVSHYPIAPGCRILELGCGTGDMWANHLDLLDGGTSLTLTDFSRGMVDTARCRLGNHPGIICQVADIQDIPFGDQSFDLVIANMMLYHVPDLHRGLSEVRRVLKPGGVFCCATYGIHGIAEYVTELLDDLGVSARISTSFTLQNGGAILSRYFPRVTRLDREDGLAITDVSDFADYIHSLSSLTNVHTVPRPLLLERLEGRKENGVLYVPKEYGMFVCCAFEQFDN